MNKAKFLINIINEEIEKYADRDFHNIIGVMVTCTHQGRLMRIQDQTNIINQYFEYSPEVFEYVKSYKPSRLMRFLERIIHNKKFIEKLKWRKK